MGQGKRLTMRQGPDEEEAIRDEARASSNPG
jgi:hypothetical protein